MKVALFLLISCSLIACSKKEEPAPVPVPVPTATVAPSASPVPTPEIMKQSKPAAEAKKKDAAKSPKTK